MLSSAASRTGHEGQRFEVDLQLASRQSRHVDEIVHELRLRLGIAIDQFECVPACRLAEMIVKQHPRPSKDHIQRRPKFMRQRRQEFVFQAVRFPEPSFFALMRQVTDNDRECPMPSITSDDEESCAG